MKVEGCKAQIWALRHQVGDAVGAHMVLPGVAFEAEQMIVLRSGDRTIRRDKVYGAAVTSVWKNGARPSQQQV
jgi:hypothetical protein